MENTMMIYPMFGRFALSLLMLVVLFRTRVNSVRQSSKLEDPNLFTPWGYTIVRRRAADHIARMIKERKIVTEVTKHTFLPTATSN